MQKMSPTSTSCVPTSSSAAAAATTAVNDSSSSNKAKTAADSREIPLEPEDISREWLFDVINQVIASYNDHNNTGIN
jgi:hypothetical protein